MSDDVQLLDWSTDKAEASLAALFARLRVSANNQIDWYNRKRQGKRIMAVLTRNGALVLIGAAALLPLAATVSLDGTQPAPANPIWVSIVVALAAGFVAYDRAQGFSTGWIRFVQTELQLRDALELFELDWEAQRATWRGAPPNPAQIEAMLTLARAFALQVNTTVLSETNAWVEEFQSALRQMDESLKARRAEDAARRAAPRVGAVNVNVINGDECESGWKVMATNGLESRHSGRSAVLMDVPAGLTPIKVFGLIGGAEKRAELAVAVTPGATTSVDLTLA